MLLCIIVMCAIDVNQLRWKRWLLRLRLIRDYAVPRTATINTVGSIRKWLFGVEGLRRWLMLKESWLSLSYWLFITVMKHLNGQWIIMIMNMAGSCIELWGHLLWFHNHHLVVIIHLHGLRLILLLLRLLLSRLMIILHRLSILKIILNLLELHVCAILVCYRYQHWLLSSLLMLHHVWWKNALVYMKLVYIRGNWWWLLVLRCERASWLSSRVSSWVSNWVACVLTFRLNERLYSTHSSSLLRNVSYLIVLRVDTVGNINNWYGLIIHSLPLRRLL